LAVMSLPVLAFVLATQGELAWRRGLSNFEEDRLFIVSEPTSGGLGYFAARIVRDESPADGPLCVHTTVTYFLWRNDENISPNVNFCQCYTRASAGQFELSDIACAGE
jgi:hypothetical protein